MKQQILNVKKLTVLYNTVQERPTHTSKTAQIILLGIVETTNWFVNQFVPWTRPSKMIFAVLDVWIGRSYTVLYKMESFFFTFNINKFHIRSFTRSWDIMGYRKKLGVTRPRPCQIFEKK